MDWNELEVHFSPVRLGRYRAARGGDVVKAAMDYADNLLLAEAMLPMLNVLEIALRNGIHARLRIRYGREDWWEAWVGDSAFERQCHEIVNAKTKLRKRNESQTADKILAELTFGFWCSLFNTQMQAVLWKDLRLVFAHCPKSQRQRRIVSSVLNRIRSLRNRVFHHESLLWLSPVLVEQHVSGRTILRWMDPKLEQWLMRHDRLQTVWAEYRAKDRVGC